MHSMQSIATSYQTAIPKQSIRIKRLNPAIRTRRAPDSPIRHRYRRFSLGYAKFQAERLSPPAIPDSVRPVQLEILDIPGHQRRISLDDQKVFGIFLLGGFGKIERSGDQG